MPEQPEHHHPQSHLHVSCTALLRSDLHILQAARQTANMHGQRKSSEDCAKHATLLQYTSIQLKL